MSKLHLSTGSVEPARVEGLLRLYSMRYCPYVHRSRLVLNHKKIPHDLVNINLVNKPEWYFKIHPEGKVPALLDGDKVIVESLDVCDYLDEKYPEVPLYPAEPAAKEQDKELIKKIESVTSVYFKLLFGTEKKSAEEWAKDFLDVLRVFEDALVIKGGAFFGGDKPGMVDLMFWPFAERAGAVSIKLGEKLPLAESDIPNLRKWRNVMKDVPAVAEIAEPIESFWKVLEIKLNNAEPNYDF